MHRRSQRPEVERHQIALSQRPPYRPRRQPTTGMSTQVHRSGYSVRRQKSLLSDGSPTLCRHAEASNRTPRPLDGVSVALLRSRVCPRKKRRTDAGNRAPHLSVAANLSTWNPSSPASATRYRRSFGGGPRYLTRTACRCNGAAPAGPKTVRRDGTHYRINNARN